ncbi:hypothetical protein C8D70_11555 [Chryseobacterium sp. CBTAP 102]|nr:hypothetical protein C8D70_11555 [Chryseobacterium sp. CBTAP 102]
MNYLNFRGGRQFNDIDFFFKSHPEMINLSNLYRKTGFQEI